MAKKSQINNLIFLYLFTLFLSEIQNQIDQPQIPTKTYPTTYIGVISQPAYIYNNLDPKFDQSNSYITSSYVKYIEQTGAQSLLIPWDLPQPELYNVLNQTSGFLLPGGHTEQTQKNHTETSPYMDRIYLMVEFAKNLNEAGRFFGVYGVCLGLEELMLSLSNKNMTTLVNGFNDEDYVHEIAINQKLFKNSKLFSIMEYYKSNFVFEKKRMIFIHNSGISPKVVRENPILKNEINIIGTSKSLNGKEFVSILEHKRYPFYAQQPHLEKNQFERKNPITAILENSKETIDVTSDVMKSFIELLRLNCQSVDLDEVGKGYLSYNFVAWPDIENVFDSVYLFRKMENCGEKCYEWVSSSGYQDEVYWAYKNVRDVKYFVE